MTYGEFEALPSAVLQRAYTWKGECAWRRDDALHVCSLLQALGIAVLGGEVWLPRHGAGPAIPFPGVYVWACEGRGKSESWADYVRRTAALASRHIEQFEWESPLDDREPWFNLTVDGVGVHPES